jgi:hypothetical protein
MGTLDFVDNEEEEIDARSTHAKPVVGRRRLDKLTREDGKIAERDAPLVVMMLRPPSPLHPLSLFIGVALALIRDVFLALPPLPSDQSSDDLPMLGGATISS